MNTKFAKGKGPSKGRQGRFGLTSTPSLCAEPQRASTHKHSAQVFPFVQINKNGKHCQHPSLSGTQETVMPPVFTTNNSKNLPDEIFYTLPDVANAGQSAVIARERGFYLPRNVPASLPVKFTA